MTVYLASSSPRRAQILTSWGIPFSLVDGHVDEVMHEDAPEQSARDNALAKARAGAADVAEGMVIGADTVVACDGHILGKPANQSEARQMLLLLEGREHRVITAMAGILVPSGRTSLRVSTSRVTMRRLAQDETERYLANPEYLDKAGAYAVQGLAASFIERTDGPLDTIVGFTMRDFYALCAELNVDVGR